MNNNFNFTGASGQYPIYEYIDNEINITSNFITNTSNTLQTQISNTSNDLSEYQNLIYISKKEGGTQSSISFRTDKRHPDQIDVENPYLYSQNYTLTKVDYDNILKTRLVSDLSVIGDFAETFSVNPASYGNILLKLYDYIANGNIEFELGEGTINIQNFKEQRGNIILTDKTLSEILNQMVELDIISDANIVPEVWLKISDTLFALLADLASTEVNTATNTAGLLAVGSSLAATIETLGGVALTTAVLESQIQSIFAALGYTWFAGAIALGVNEIEDVIIGSQLRNKTELTAKDGFDPQQFVIEGLDNTPTEQVIITYEKDEDGNID